MSQYVNISILEGSIMTILKYEGLSKDTSNLKQSSTVLKQRLYCVYFMNESVFKYTKRRSSILGYYSEADASKLK